MSVLCRRPQARKLGGLCGRLAVLVGVAGMAIPAARADESPHRPHVRPAAEEVFGVPVEGGVVQDGRPVSRLPAQHAGAGIPSQTSKAGDPPCTDGCARAECQRGRCWHGTKLAHRWFNCDCHGSYKFPVPPLYTYHWPGIYSLQLTTDYHSPWRFPPLRPYSAEPDDETLAPNDQARVDAPKVMAVGWEAAPPSDRKPPREPPGAGLLEPVSSKMERHYGR